MRITMLTQQGPGMYVWWLNHFSATPRDPFFACGFRWTTFEGARLGRGRPFTTALVEECLERPASWDTNLFCKKGACFQIRVSQ